MHNMLAALLSVFFLSSSTTARVIPPALEYTCSFTLWHKQLQPFDVKHNYVQINTLIDHTNSVTVDVAHARPAAAFHSYTYVGLTQAYAIAGLLNGSNLTIRGEDGSDRLRFQREEMVWTADGESDVVAEAWCQVGEWEAGVRDGKVNTRERRLECAFLCEKIEMDEEERIEMDEEEGIEMDEQERIELKI